VGRLTELGKFLREKREEKGMSLEELQTATKIQKRYLAAIEEGNYDVLPGTFYARAFIKNYSEAVGLDYETIFNEYAHDIPQAAKEVNPEFEPRSKRAKAPVDTKDSLIKRMVPAMLVGLLIIVLLSVGYMLLPEGNDEAKNGQNNFQPVELDEDENKPAKNQDEEEANEEEPNEEEPEEEPLEEEAPPQQKLTKIGTTGKVTTFELSNAEQLVIDLSATGDSYVGVTDETGKSYFNTTLKQDETKQFDLTAAKEVTLNIGASHVTTIKINNEPFEYPVPPKDMVHQKIIIKKVQ
jgi:cytoskeletal protein RodZ